MALQALSDEGQLEWTCHCGEQKSEHLSHDEIQYCHRPGTPNSHRTVALPICTCGMHLFLKVDFTEAELSAPNMVTITTDGVALPTPSYDTALRHMRLAALLDAAGKGISDADADSETG